MLFMANQFNIYGRLFTYSNLQFGAVRLLSSSRLSRHPGQRGCLSPVLSDEWRIVPPASWQVTRAYSCPTRPPPGQICGAPRKVSLANWQEVRFYSLHLPTRQTTEQLCGGWRKLPPIICQVKPYSLCCPPRPPPGTCGCPNPVPGGGRRIVPPSSCRPGPIPPNPCVPIFHHGKDTWKKYKYLTFFVCIPLIMMQAFHAFNHEIPPKDVCRDYEYMRIRSKRFPWGDGVKSLFHNDHVNFLPGECEPPPLDCD